MKFDNSDLIMFLIILAVMGVGFVLGPQMGWW